MKNYWLVVLSSIFFIGFSEAASPIKISRKITQFYELTSSERELWRGFLKEAISDISKKDFATALIAIQKAEVICADRPEVYLLKAISYLYFRQFDKAIAYFEWMAKNSNVSREIILFNLNETYFVSQQWKKSIQLTKQINKEFKKTSAFEQTRLAIVDFKYFISLLKLGKIKEAKKVIKIDDTLFGHNPTNLLAKAVLEFEKNPSSNEGNYYLTIAQVAFKNNPSLISLWLDALLEAGYLDKSYNITNL